ncbi:Uncharacterised protein [Legionella lansingensis]|uniref:Uncharacterized protein n=1 Tax=Legionella lansingensis TaxID=45067 RepID=A0A0W0VUQ1_9GAMM|nr:hypothetical protein [Legionella lansingensis]KTD23852.1 hypothetical protein Llan_0633 [Legionella lansingensis]SNV46670.1 Uncharacterised protein [Legionella lansingensis]
MPSYGEITSKLKKGPRLKSDATKDLEDVVRIFLDTSQKSICQFNHYGELEVRANGKIFNLTQILLHQPDFEHFQFTEQELKKYEPFVKTAKHLPSLAGSPTLPKEQDYDHADREKKIHATHLCRKTGHHLIHVAIL